jgi:hypothetical protein
MSEQSKAPASVAEKKAPAAGGEHQMQSLPIRAYLDQTVVPILL